MGLLDYLRRAFKPSPTPDEAREDPAAAPQPPSAPPPPEATERPSLDVVGDLTRMPLGEAIPRAIEQLELARSKAAAASLLRWLREVALRKDAPARARLGLADFFLARAEPELGEQILRDVAAGPIADAPAALMRLGDAAASVGDDVEAARRYEHVLALDLEYPGARERHARLKRGPRAGEAGATLMAPNASVGVGRFELVKELGRGSAGAVFEARDKRLGRHVALKLYHPQARSDRNARLRGEALVAASVSGVGVVRVFDLFEDVGALVMEFASGGSIRTQIARGSVQPSAAHGWLLDVARALAHTHERGWVHRDLKPGNVLLRGDGRAALTDFGLARKVGVVCVSAEGTAGYIAPETTAGAPADPRADVFAFGVLARDLVGNDPRYAALIEACRVADPEKRLRDGAAVLVRLRGI